ncbi:MAG: pilus assembly protein [Gemmataceae bacterium]|nr:pilus assembly protein [Gemmataceae bacterium]MDW8264904.1 TadE/TadG family type IV pilus assembly protein [Gemmataceae bacterium]
MHADADSQAPRSGRRRSRRRWGGLLTFELLLVVPIWLALLGAALEFGTVLIVRQQLLAASRDGARVAALGGDLEDVRQAVRRALGPGRLPGAAIYVRMFDEQGRPLAPGETVEVWVRLPVAQAAPNFLSLIGASLPKGDLVARTAMRKE